MYIRSIMRAVVLPAFLTWSYAQGADAGTGAGTKVAFEQELSPPITRSSDELVLSAAPREPIEQAKAIYDPIAEYLSKVIGKKVVYRYPGNWGVYQGQMQKGAYDLVFDGAHFNGWRVEKLKYNILVKIPNELSFVVITKKDEKLSNVSELYGRLVCAHAPPNLATLIFLDQFNNPSRQPVLQTTEGWDNIYRGVVAGKCIAGALPLKFVQKNDPDGVATKVIFKARPLPDNALSASPRISPKDQEKITQALVSPEGTVATSRLIDAYAPRGKKFVPASNEEYAKLGQLLKNEWGYY